MKKRKFIGISIFIIGFAILIYPIISQTYYDNVYRQEVEQINEGFTETSELSAQLYQQQLSYNQGNVTQLDEIEMANVSYVEAEIENQAELTSTDLYNEAILGTLSIPKIDLALPIYDGASDEHLAMGLARVEGTSYPVGGINTNSVISGHNGLTSRSYFSNIDKLTKGDLIYVQNRMELIAYEVYAMTVIEPTEVSALAIVPGQDTLTLLTCTGAPLGTHRYLVYARRVATEESPGTEQSTSVSTSAVDETILTSTEDAQVINPGTSSEAESSETDSNETDNTVNETSEPSQDIAETLSTFVSRYGLLIVLIVAGLLTIYFVFIREKEE